jgi:hypothetical protein
MVRRTTVHLKVVPVMSRRGDIRDRGGTDGSGGPRQVAVGSSHQPGAAVAGARRLGNVPGAPEYSTIVGQAHVEGRIVDLKYQHQKFFKQMRHMVRIAPEPVKEFETPGGLSLLSFVLG